MGLTPMIVVQDVEASSAWYQELLGLRGAHGGEEFEMLVDGEGALQLLLHHPEHVGVETPRPGEAGTGVLFYFSVSNLESYVDRAEVMNVEVLASPHFNENARATEFTIKDLDGYLITISQWQGGRG